MANLSILEEDNVIPIVKSQRKIIVVAGGDITFTSLTRGKSTSDPQNTASISPVTGSELLMTVAVSILGGGTVDPDDALSLSGVATTWTLIATAADIGNDRRRLWVYRGHGTMSSGEITINPAMDAGTFEEVIWSVVQVENINTVTPYGTPQTTTQTSGTSLNLADVGTIDVGDYVFAAFRIETAETISANPGTVLDSINDGTGVRSIMVCYQNTDDTPGATWTTNSNNAGIAFTVEKI